MKFNHYLSLHLAALLLLSSLNFAFIESKTPLLIKSSYNKVNLDFTDKELIVGVEELTDKKVDVIKDAIYDVPGVTYKDYCPKMNLIMLTFDETRYSSKEEVVRTISNKVSKITFLIKEGSIADITKSCSK